MAGSGHELTMLQCIKESPNASGGHLVSNSECQRDVLGSSARLAAAVAANVAVGQQGRT